MLKANIRIMNASKRCQRTVVQFLTAKNATAGEIDHRIQNVYGVVSTSHKLAFRWYGDFRSGRRAHVLD